MMNMNNEEFDRRMAFIVEQQAQFASDIQQLQESQARTDQVVAQTAEVVGQFGEVVTRLANVTHAGFTEVNAKINALIDAQIRTEENIARLEKNTEENIGRLEKNIARLEKNVARTDENVARLEKNVARTDENLMRTEKNVASTDQSLKNLIAVVERYISRGNPR